MTKINKIKAREILDSRGNPTVEVDVFCNDGSFGRAKVPSGASTGEHEALELRDKDKRFHGRGVLKAISNINNIIAPKIVGYDVTQQEEIDKIMIEMDGTENKSKLGANAILGVSLAVCIAASNSKKVSIYKYLNENANTIPVPMFNVINGGKHAGGNLKIQEFMIVPHGFKLYRNALRAASEIYHVLKNNLKQYGPSAINLGDEGGFGSPVDTAPEALNILVKSIEEAGYHAGKEVSIALDAAASEFFKDNKYEVDGKLYTGEELIDYYIGLVNSYPLISLEDPFDENDFETFAKLKAKLNNIAIVADDLTVTNPKRIKKAIEEDAANYLLLKVNQIGSLTEAINAANIAKKAGWGINISHRSGETEDTFIADLAVGIGAERIKTGAPARGERTAKYNQLLRIEEELGDNAKFLGTK